MSFSTLPNDPIYEILYRLGPAELINQCESDYRFNRLCQDPNFLSNYFARYGMVIGEVPGRTSRQKLHFLSAVETADLNTFVQDQYATMINPGFRNVLGKAVQTGNPQFVQLVLNRLLERIGRENLPQYSNSFRDPLVDLLTNANRPRSLKPPQVWYQIADILMKYYNPRWDQVIFRVYGDAIRQGNLARVQGLSMIIGVDQEGFWVAVENARPTIAQFLWNALQALNINPVANNPGAVREIYEDAIYNDNINIAKTMARFAPPNEAILAEAEQANALRVAAFIRNLLQGQQ